MSNLGAFIMTSTGSAALGPGSIRRLRRESSRRPEPMEITQKLVLHRGNPVGMISNDFSGQNAIRRGLAVRFDVHRKGHSRAPFASAVRVPANSLPALKFDS